MDTVNKGNGFPRRGELIPDYSDMSTPNCVKHAPWNVNSHIEHWTQKSVCCQPEHLRQFKNHNDDIWREMLSNYWQYFLFTTCCPGIAQKKGQFNCFYFLGYKCKQNLIWWPRAQKYPAGMQNYKQTSSL